MIMMMILMMMMTIIIITTYQENMKSSNCSKQPYWALHTHCGKYWCKITVDSTLKLTV
jgi:hypothetical protein